MPKIAASELIIIVPVPLFLFREFSFNVVDESIRFITCDLFKCLYISS